MLFDKIFSLFSKSWSIIQSYFDIVIIPIIVTTIAGLILETFKRYKARRVCIKFTSFTTKNPDPNCFPDIDSEYLILRLINIGQNKLIVNGLAVVFLPENILKRYIYLLANKCFIPNWLGKKIKTYSNTISKWLI